MESSKTTYDLIVIGSGPGGYVAAIRASQLGMKSAVVENQSLGGICLNWGCIPTKALLKSAQVLQYARQAEAYGVRVGEVEPDLAAMVARSRAISDQMRKGVSFLLKKHKVDVLHGTGSLENSQQVNVKHADGSSACYLAQNIILATGSRSRIVASMPVDHQRVLDYKDALSLTELPESIAIVGAGAIGVEFAHFYAALGVQVSLIEYKSHILSAEDVEVSNALARSFMQRGIQVHTDTQVQSLEVNDKEGSCMIHLEKRGGSQTIVSDRVLSAVGTVPNLEPLGIEKIGLTLRGDKIDVDSFYRTNVSHIYAIGDIIDGPALAHAASAEAIVCVEKIAGLHPDPIDPRNIPSCVYCAPEVASVGYTEEEARQAGYTLRIGKFPLSASGKAHASGASEGFVKVIFDAQYGEWLGAHMIGENVTELISQVVTARKLETTAREIITSVHPHPTFSEALMEATAAAYDESVHV